MSIVRPSVLIIGHPEPNLVQFGAEFLDDLSELKASLESHQYRVVIYPTHIFKNSENLKYLEILEKQSKKNLAKFEIDFFDL